MKIVVNKQVVWHAQALSILPAEGEGAIHEMTTFSFKAGRRKTNMNLTTDDITNALIAATNKVSRIIGKAN